MRPNIMVRLLRLGLCSIGLSAASYAAGVDLGNAINQLGLDLYRQLATKQPEGNLVLSPYSAESCLALAFAGADGTTRTEMATTLHLPANDDSSVRDAFASLRTTLTALATRTARPIELATANRLYAQSGYPFRPAYLDLMRDGYAAALEQVDFRRDASQVRQSINHWVADQTHSRIRDLLPAGAIASDTRLVLVNAVYLMAPWETAFKRKNTRAQVFNLAHHETHRIPTMQRTDFLGYAHEDGFTVVSLDYAGRDLQCLILLPDPDRTPDEIGAKLTPADFARWTKLGQRSLIANVALYLPKFTLESRTMPLGKGLRDLGMTSAFNRPPGSANFDRLAPREPNDSLALSEVFQKTFIALDEEKTEAAAATASTFTLSAHAVSSDKPIEVRVDRPFLIAIQHRASGVCLFLGRISDPR